MQLSDPRQIAVSVVGSADWKSEVSGFCKCPGEALHTHRTGKKDCRVCVDGAPTIYCFHSSCAPAVAEASSQAATGVGLVAVDADVAGWTGVAKRGHFAEGPDGEGAGDY